MKSVPFSSRLDFQGLTLGTASRKLQGMKRKVQGEAAECQPQVLAKGWEQRLFTCQNLTTNTNRVQGEPFTLCQFGMHIFPGMAFIQADVSKNFALLQQCKGIGASEHCRLGT